MLVGGGGGGGGEGGGKQQPQPSAPSSSSCGAAAASGGCCFLASLWSCNNNSVEIFSYESVQDSLLCVYERMNRCASISRDIVLWRDPIASTKIGVLLWCVGKVASWLSFAQLSFVCIWVVMCGSVVRDLLYVQHIQPLLSPHAQALQQKVVQMVDVIPRMKTYKKQT
eukprot:GHVS01025623.1.p1 GENE.GHVS01025623.1~~GHVS01025623.1.p1  ORF type:complete len:168 (+),score=46.74 GHVS01025623.1:262-765(+)